MSTSNFKVGDVITFTPGRAYHSVTAEITEVGPMFLTTKDADGKIRKTRPGPCSLPSTYH